jgi:hypothetical protein
MTSLCLLMALMAAPFWNTKLPNEWTPEELNQLMRDSPWARDSGTQIYLASARPMREAERRLNIAQPKSSPNGEIQDDSDYLEFLRENSGKYIIVAIRLPDPNALAETEEARFMEEKCVLKVGRKRYKMTGHFPPTPSDPYLRLIYPRAVDASVKRFSLELYLPSVAGPFRIVEFDLKEMVYKGILEM